MAKYDAAQMARTYSNPANFDYARDESGHIVSRVRKYAMISWDEAQALVKAAKKGLRMARKSPKKMRKAASKEASLRAAMKTGGAKKARASKAKGR